MSTILEALQQLDWWWRVILATAVLGFAAAVGFGIYALVLKFLAACCAA